MRAADLRFVTDEVSVFFQVAMGLNLAQQDIVALQARIEGWAAGLQLAALSLNNCRDISGFLQSFTGTHHFVLDYLSEEVLSRLPGRVQSFLLQTSILERLCGSLCDAVTEQETGQAMLEMLYRENLFVVALDDERRWYRYHHLFTDVLLNRLQQSQPGLIPELHRRASFWYEQHGLLAEAVQHALAAPDFEYAASLIEQKGWSLVRRGQIHTLLGWLNLLPSDLMLLHPLLCVYHAMMLMATSQMEAARSRLQDAEHCLDSSTPSSETKTIRVWLAIACSDISSYTGDLVRCVAFAQQALDLWSRSEGRMLAGILANSIQAYQVSGDVTTASEQVIAASIAPARVSDNPFVFLRSITSLARLKALQGHLRQALTTYEKTMHLTSQQEELRLNISGSAYYFGLGDLMRERNDLNTAEHLLREGMNIVRETLLVEADVVLLGYTAQARLLQARGKYAQALATLGEFLHVAQQRHYFPLLVAQALATKAQVELAQGNLAAAKHWADSCGLSIEDGIDFLREREYLALARVLIAEGQFEPTDHYLQHALSILDRLLQDAEVKARLGSAIEILLLYALALEAKSHRTESLRMLERALTLAEPEGYVRVFVDEGRPMAALLSRARRQGIAGHYIAGLLTTFEDEGTTIISHSLANPGPLVEPLTERERDVLHLLMTGASNSEIAHLLIISLNTVKKHVYNICGKLGVQNRAQAIVKARSLDLL